MSAFLIRETENSNIPAMARIRAAKWETEEYWSKRIHAYLAGELDPKFALKPRVSYTCCEAKSIIGFIAGTSRNAIPARESSSGSTLCLKNVEVEPPPSCFADLHRRLFRRMLFEFAWMSNPQTK